MDKREYVFVTGGKRISLTVREKPSLLEMTIKADAIELLSDQSVDAWLYETRDSIPSNIPARLTVCAPGIIYQLFYPQGIRRSGEDQNQDTTKNENITG